MGDGRGRGKAEKVETAEGYESMERAKQGEGREGKGRGGGEVSEKRNVMIGVGKQLRQWLLVGRYEKRERNEL